jgi:hypothetical protein
MKKPATDIPIIPKKLAKLISKSQKENCSTNIHLAAEEELLLTRAVAYYQQLRVSELIQQLNS